ncbi:hypothetical protein [Rhodococcus sp. YH3-3]|uniref:hypothetical protein n=1 Tax=Rhodococcus sp. YH3-3 TaxID=1803579 RepID=UPI0007DB3744|nr:hypothetical protein [Rhodococcus sp. YH3-3]
MEVITQVSALCDDLVETEQIKAREHTPDEVLSAGRPYLAVVKGEELSKLRGPRRRCTFCVFSLGEGPADAPRVS